jgi:hypothetical protein
MAKEHDLPDGTSPDDPGLPGAAGTPGEEQLNIEGGEPVGHVTSEGQEGEDTRNRMQQHVANLAGVSTPGDNADEFLDKLLQTPHDQLIPWEDCYLPSKGLYYDGAWDDGLVKVRAMGQTAEKILATQRLAQSGQSIDYLFRECCQFPEGFDPINLLLGDRVFLLYFIRGITHGNVYEFAFTCPNQDCQAVSTHVYDLNELAGTVTWANPSLGGEPFRVDLPYLSAATEREVWVSVRFLRAYDANDILARRKAKDKTKVRPGSSVRTRNRQRPMNPAQQRQQMQQLDDTITENLEKVIVNVMGSSDPIKRRQFVTQMHAQDTATVREWLRENTPGIDNSVIVGCPDCNTEHTVELPITEAFFRPSKPAGV